MKKYLLTFSIFFFIFVSGANAITFNATTNTQYVDSNFNILNRFSLTEIYVPKNTSIIPYGIDLRITGNSCFNCNDDGTVQSVGEDTCWAYTEYYYSYLTNYKNQDMAYLKSWNTAEVKNSNNTSYQLVNVDYAPQRYPKNLYVGLTWKFKVTGGTSGNSFTSDPITYVNFHVREQNSVTDFSDIPFKLSDADNLGFWVQDRQLTKISCEELYSANTENSQDIIINQNEQTNEKLDETNDSLNELNDNLTNSDQPDNLHGLSNSAGWLPAGPIDSILNLPLSMLTNISDNLNKSCQPVNLPLPFVNKDLPLPCLSSIYSQIDGLGPWITTISVIASAFILFSYLLKLYKWVDDTLTFRENNEIDNWGGL